KRNLSYDRKRHTARRDYQPITAEYRIERFAGTARSKVWICPICGRLHRNCFFAGRDRKGKTSYRRMATGKRSGFAPGENKNCSHRRWVQFSRILSSAIQRQMPYQTTKRQSAQLP